MSGINLAHFRDIIYVVDIIYALGDTHFQGLVKKYVSQFVVLCISFSFRICEDQMFFQALQHKLKRLKGALCLPPPCSPSAAVGCSRVGCDTDPVLLSESTSAAPHPHGLLY